MSKPFDASKVRNGDAVIYTGREGGDREAWFIGMDTGNDQSMCVLRINCVGVRAVHVSSVQLIPKTITRWVNVYEDGVAFYFNSPQDAKHDVKFRNPNSHLLRPVKLIATAQPFTFEVDE